MGKKKTKEKPDSRGPSVSIGGNVEGPVTVGDGNITVGSVSEGGSVIVSNGAVSQTFTLQQQNILKRVGTAEEIKSLETIFNQLSEEIKSAAPKEIQPKAKEQAEQLKEEVLSEKPDPTIIKQAKSWFISNLPAVLGTVTGILTHPIVGKLVESAGEYTLKNFRERLGLPNEG